MIDLHKIGITLGLVFFLSCSTTKTKNLDADVRKGSSFESAIKVWSASAEYKHIDKQCNNCEIVRKRSRIKEDIAYNIYYVSALNGDTLVYYFDITKYYGKIL